MLRCVVFFVRVKQSAYPLFPLELFFRLFRNFPILRAKLYDIRGKWKQNAQVISSFQIFRPSFVCGRSVLQNLLGLICLKSLQWRVPVMNSLSASYELSQCQLQTLWLPVLNSLSASYELSQCQLRTVSVPVTNSLSASYDLSECQFWTLWVPVMNSLSASYELSQCQL